MEDEMTDVWYQFVQCEQCGVKIQTEKEGLPPPETQRQQLLHAIQVQIQNTPNLPPGVTAEMVLAQTNPVFRTLESNTLAQFNNMPGKDLCRGQGRFYSTRLYPPIPPVRNHFTFSGYYIGCCCYCAVVVKDWDLDSVNELGCYLCKEPLLQCLAFKHIRRSTTFWRHMPETVFNLIMRFLVGREERKTILMHA